MSLRRQSLEILLALKKYNPKQCNTINRGISELFTMRPQLKSKQGRCTTYDKLCIEESKSADQILPSLCMIPLASQITNKTKTTKGAK